MEEGKIEAEIEKAAKELAEFSQYTTSIIDPDLNYNAHEAYEIQEIKKNEQGRQKGNPGSNSRQSKWSLQNLSRVRENKRAINRAMADLQNLQ